MFEKGKSEPAERDQPGLMMGFCGRTLTCKRLSSLLRSEGNVVVRDTNAPKVVCGFGVPVRSTL
jgi:hypothetical protein